MSIMRSRIICWKQIEARYRRRGFELSARRIGQLMQDQFNVGFVDVGGWDTHVNQGAATGYLADRIGELGRGLAGFAEEIGSEWNATPSWS